eukprot:TRINITY_DN11619_c0_g2_i7.p1 TRINITY_DN11619_c0_g2~~TRINITY_DN11619_c0_g2_i7.p1  ORF type:complete len:730 (+),score=135.69 TRINITY_DN11619_c0_g2_i7:127-2316(+)
MASRPPPPPIKPRAKPSLEQGQVKASDLQLSSDELIGLMERVKAGNMSVDDAVCEVLTVDGTRKDYPQLSASTASPRLRASEEGATSSPPRLTQPSSQAAVAPVPMTAAAMPAASAGSLSNAEQLEVMRRVKEGSLTVDEALAIAQSNGQSSPQVPIVLKEDVALKLALADAGADVGLTSDNADDIASAQEDNGSRGPANNAHDDGMAAVSVVENDGEPILAAQPSAVADSASMPSSDGNPDNADTADNPDTIPALHRSDSDVADILRLYGMTNDPQATSGLLEAPDTPDVRTSPTASLFSLLADNASIHSQDQPVRVAIVANRARHKSALITLPHTYPELLALASRKLDMDAKRVYSKSGALVTDLSCLRDEDELFVSAGEGFRQPGRATSLTSLNSLCSSTLGGRDTPSGDGRDPDGWVKLNVGGRVFETTMTTLSRVPDSMLKTMLTSDHWKSTLDDQGAIRIDRNPRYFEPLLTYMRDGTFILDPGLSARGVLAEAHYFGLWDLVDVLEPMAAEEAVQLEADPPIRRKELARLLLSTSGRHGDLRCQGLNFTGSDLSKMDLSGINFRYAKLDDCNLSHCQLQNCCFEGASLKGAKLDHSVMMGCNLSRANFEQASLIDCNFHDPSQHCISILEGGNFRGADLEDCNLGGAVIRVACFKDASLRNCNLRSCNMAGADLSGADLSGCNLQGTNLRGTNTFRAKFHKISTAIHSSAFVDQGHFNFRRR